MCGEGKSDLFTAWFTNDDLLLVNSVGSISKLGNIEALVLNLVLALNLSDLNSLGDTDLLGSDLRVSLSTSRCSMTGMPWVMGISSFLAQNLRNNVRARHGYNVKRFREDGIGIPGMQ